MRTRAHPLPLVFICFTALLTGLALPGSAPLIAQPGPDSPPGAGKAETKLTPETLQKFLASALEEPEPVAKEGQFKYYYWLNRERVVKSGDKESNEKIYILVYLDQDNSKLRLRSELRTLPAYEVIPPNIVSAFLGRSGWKSPGAFFAADNDKLCLTVLLENRGLTPRIFAQELNKFYDTMVNNWDVFTFASQWWPREQARAWHDNKSPRYLSFFPDGQHLVTGADDGKIRFWNLQPIKLQDTIAASKDPVFSVVVTPDGRGILEGEKRGVLRLWDVNAKKEVRRFEGSQHCVWTLSLSPDGKLLASGGGAFSGKESKWVDADGRPTDNPDFVVRIWDVGSGKPLQKLEGHTGLVKGVCFSPDGQTVASTGDDGTIRLWAVTGGKEVHKYDGHKFTTEGIAFHPDGKRLITASDDKTLRLWDAETGKELRKFEGHREGVWGLDLSRDGKVLLSGSSDKTVRLWDVETGQQLLILGGHTGSVANVALSKDGKTGASASFDNYVRIWNTGR